MEVALVNNRPFDGGIGQYALNLYRSLIKYPKVETSFFQLEQTQLSLSNVLAGNRNYKGIMPLFKSNFEIVHVSCPGIISSMVIDKFKKGLIKNIIVTYHDVYLKEKINFNITEYLLRRYLDKTTQINNIIFDSKFTFERYTYYYELPDRWSVIYLGVDHSLFKKRDKKKIREKLKLDQNKKIVLYVGDTLERKNLETLFAVYYKLNRYYKNNILFVLIGGDNKKIASLKLRYNIYNVIHLKNLSVDLVAYYYNVADLMIYPSIYEGFGVPALESMSSGLPLIYSNSSSLNEIVDFGGIKIDTYDVESYFDKAVMILSEENEREKLINLGLARSENFQWDKMASETVDFYRQVLNEK